MTKRSGFAVKITAFIEADPTNMASMAHAMRTMEALTEVMKEQRFVQVTADQRFMLSREVPDAAPTDEPKAAQAAAATSYVVTDLPKGTAVTETEDFPDIPSSQRRA